MSPYLQLGLTLLLVALTGFFVAADLAPIRARAAAQETMALVRVSLNL